MKIGKMTTPLRTALTYVFFGVLWITFTDRAMDYFIPASSPTHGIVQTLKGWLFVLASASLIYLMLRRDMIALAKTQHDVTYQAGLIEDISDALISTDMQFRILTWNAAAETLYGWKASEVIGHSMNEFVQNDYINTSREEIIKAAMEQGKWKGEVTQNHKSGRRFFISTALALVKDEQDHPVGFVAINHDIDERKRAEETLRKSEQKWAFLVKTIPDYVALFDSEGKYIFLNHYAKGYSEADVLGRDCIDFIPPESKDAYLRSYETARQSGVEQFVEYLGYGDHGEIRYYDSYFTPILENGVFVNMLALARDITARKQTEESLKSSEMKYRSLVENSLQGVVIYQDQKAAYVNPAMCRINGYSEEEFLAMSAEQIVAMTHPDDLIEARERAMKRNAGEHVAPDFETRLTRKDGTVAWLHSYNTSIVYNGQPAILSTVIDITEAKLAQEAVIQSEQRFRSLIENGLDNISLLAMDGTLLWESPSTVRTLGYGQDAYKGRNILDLVHPEDLEWVGGLFREMLEMPRLAFHGTFRIHHLDGSWRWIESIGTNLLEDPSVQAIVINYRDITEKKKAEDALRTSEEKYRDLVENSQNLICTHDLEGNLLSVNEAAVLLSGYSREALLTMNLKDVMVDDKAKRQFASYITRIKADGQAHGTMKIRMANGDYRYWAFNNSLRTAGVKEPIVRGSARDVTERKLAEDALRESEERFHRAFRSSPVGMDITSSDGIFIDANDAFSEVVGFSREELLGHASLELKIVTPEQREAYTRDIREQGHIYNQEITLRHKSGEMRIVLGSMEVIELNHEACVLSTAIDITQRKQAELELIEAKILLERTFASLEEAVFVVGASNRKVLACNPVVEKMFGYKDNELIGRTTEFMYVNNTQYEEYPKKLTMALDTYGVFYDELQMRRKDGTIFPVEVTETRILDGMGNSNGVVSVVRDITERKQAEALLKQSEERYRLLFEDMPIAIWEEDFSQVWEHLDALKEQGVKDFRAYFAEHPEAVIECFNRVTVLEVNQSALTMYKAKSKEELIKYANEEMSQSDMERMQEILIALAYGSISGIWEGVEETMTNDLIEVSLSWSIVPGHEQDYSRIIVTTIDITERKKAERREQKKKQALELLARGAALPIVLEAIVAIVENDLPDSICSILLLDESKQHLVHGAAPRLPEFFNQAVDGQPIGMGQGSCGTAAFTGQRVIAQDIQTHPYWENYREIARQAGLRSCWSQPILASSGEVLGTFAVYHTQPKSPDRTELDTILSVTSLASITIEQKHAEKTIHEYAVGLERSVMQRTAELVRANRTKDEFLANMSHELRTPLNSVLGYSETLLEGVRGPLEERQAQAVELIYSSGEHLLGLINDILDVSKIDAGKFEIHPEVVVVNEICQSSLNFIKQLAGKKSITVEYNAPPISSTMMADPKRIKQILVNLLNNAVKFTPEKGKVSLEVQPDSEQKQMRFSISDTGIGIEANDLKKLFSPFVQLDSSLSRHYEGSGLGLVLVKQLTEIHGGTVQVQSEVGKGSCFTVILPWHEKEGDTDGGLFVIEREHEKSIPVPIPSNGIKILLAEDNEANVMMVKDYLENHGYQIFVAHHGGEAIEKAGEISPDLILMDIQMPQMDGLEATRRLRATPKFATIPIIALTAFAMLGDRERCLEAGVSEYMSKPVNLKRLLELISHLIQ